MPPWLVLALMTLAHALGALSVLAVAPLAPFLLESMALSPESIAAYLCISPRQMHRVFEVAGKTVAAEVRRIRLERAVQLLQTCPQMPITDIAFACGFESLATFYRCFKAEFQATASEIRAGAPR